MRRITILCVWAVFALTNGCANHSELELGGQQWMLVELNASGITQDKTTPYIQLDTTKLTVSGYAGCNRFQGGYTRENEHFKFGPMISTRMACVDRDALETTFLKAVEACAIIVVNDNVLEMHDDSNKVLARFKAK